MTTAIATLSPPPGLSIEELETGDSGAVILSFPVPDVSTHARRLTSAERAVAHGILHGLTYGQVAEKRGVSERTVANQVAAVFSKLKVASRLDLALLMRNELAF
jgi:DNA-binding NarL/FixJ family response regulator